MKKIVFSHTPKFGGPRRFQDYLVEQISHYSWQVSGKNNLKNAELAFVNIGTKDFIFLIKCKIYKVPIVLRLDGVNWDHRCNAYSLKAKIYQEARNIIMQSIRRFFASHIIYQSEYIKSMWDFHFGAVNTPYSIIYNGVCPNAFCPSRHYSESKSISLLCVEGSIQNKPHIPILFNSISEKLIKKGLLKEIVLVGKLNYSLKNELKDIEGLKVQGVVNKDQMSKLYQNSSLFLCLELNPPCPNSVLEAMACGLPILGYDTGALKELVGSEAGILLNYDTNPYDFTIPNTDHLVSALAELLMDEKKMFKMSENARIRSINNFNINLTLKKYFKLFNEL